MVSLLAIILMSQASSPKKVWIDISRPAIRQQVQQLPVGFIEQQQEHWYAFHVDNVQVLNDHNIPYIEAPPSPIPIVANDDDYLQPAEFVDALQKLAQNYPDLSSFHILGSSVEGRDIAAIRITASTSPLPTVKKWNFGRQNSVQKYQVPPKATRWSTPLNQNSLILKRSPWN